MDTETSRRLRSAITSATKVMEATKPPGIIADVAHSPDTHLALEHGERAAEVARQTERRMLDYGAISDVLGAGTSISDAIEVGAEIGANATAISDAIEAGANATAVSDVIGIGTGTSTAEIASRLQSQMDHMASNIRSIPSPHHEVALPPPPDAGHDRRHREAMERRDATVELLHAQAQAVQTLVDRQEDERAERDRERAQERAERERERADDRRRHRRNLVVASIGAFFAGVGAFAGAWQLALLVSG